ncbi:hypothetical protein F5Y18DRAFT_324275 [Xylariaceae sp. FL1019]|nr:hypothetical protein F5Y18DRAFT_324275 [Xylariaceae sp. FL1019]
MTLTFGTWKFSRSVHQFHARSDFSLPLSFTFPNSDDSAQKRQRRTVRSGEMSLTRPLLRRLREGLTSTAFESLEVAATTPKHNTSENLVLTPPFSPRSNDAKIRTKFYRKNQKERYLSKDSRVISQTAIPKDRAGCKTLTTPDRALRKLEEKMQKPHPSFIVETYVENLQTRVERFLPDGDRLVDKFHRIIEKGNYSTNAALRAWIPKFARHTRRVKVFRMWLLDYHVVKQLGHVLRRIDSDIFFDEGMRKDLGTQLSSIRYSLQLIESILHVPRIAQERMKLFALVKTLRGLEGDILRRETQWDGREGQLTDFPHAALEEVEIRLLTAETLSMQLVVRKSLRAGYYLQIRCAQILRELGCEPDFHVPQAKHDVD